MAPSFNRNQMGQPRITRGGEIRRLMGKLEGDGFPRLQDQRGQGQAITMSRMADQQMIEQYLQLLRLRFDEKNRRMSDRFTEEKQRLNARGLLISFETVKAMHKVLITELKESADAVVTTAIDVISKKDLLLSEKTLQDLCADALSKRSDEIEALYLSAVDHIERGLQNKAMLQPHMALGDFYPLQREEMLINLSIGYKKHMRDQGGNLTGVIRNRFLNRPMIAWASIVIAVILLVATFVGAISALWSSFQITGAMLKLNPESQIVANDDGAECSHLRCRLT
ncbi:MAG: hypothetical protein Q8M11_21130 [Sulfuritalea sp.]|nr:hypothetical protein [Sulfuritalea sp.]MDP1982624.1 hypothetical protein [Sulfuritalea sp.]